MHFPLGFAPYRLCTTNRIIVYKVTDAGEKLKSKNGNFYKYMNKFKKKILLWSGPVCSLLFGISSDYMYAQPITANYWSNLPCDWPSTAWAYSEQETKNEPRCSTGIPIPLHSRTGIPKEQGKHMDNVGLAATLAARPPLPMCFTLNLDLHKKNGYVPVLSLGQGVQNSNTSMPTSTDTTTHHYTYKEKKTTTNNYTITSGVAYAWIQRISGFIKHSYNQGRRCWQIHFTAKQLCCAE